MFVCFSQFLCERLIVCEVSTFRRGLLKVLARALEPLHVTQEEQVHELYEGFPEKFRAVHTYGTFRSALGDVLNIDTKSTLSQNSFSEEAYDEDMKIATVNKDVLTKYIVSRIQASPHVVNKHI